MTFAEKSPDNAFYLIAYKIFIITCCITGIIFGSRRGSSSDAVVIIFCIIGMAYIGMIWYTSCSDMPEKRKHMIERDIELGLPYNRK